MSTGTIMIIIGCIGFLLFGTLAVMTIIKYDRKRNKMLKNIEDE